MRVKSSSTASSSPGCRSTSVAGAGWFQDFPDLASFRHHDVPGERDGGGAVPGRDRRGAAASPRQLETVGLSARADVRPPGRARASASDFGIARALATRPRFSCSTSLSVVSDFLGRLADRAPAACPAHRGHAHGDRAQSRGCPPPGRSPDRDAPGRGHRRGAPDAGHPRSPRCAGLLGASERLHA